MTDYPLSRDEKLDAVRFWLDRISAHTFDWRSFLLIVIACVSPVGLVLVWYV